MIQSMTGFATKTVTVTAENNEKSDIIISIKALNSRFFDTTCKIHYTLSSLEHTITSKVKKALHRGHIYITIHVSNSNAFRGAVQPSLATIQSYVVAIEQIRNTAGIQESATLSDILQLPNVFSSPEQELTQETKQLVTDTIADILNTVIKVRTQEGAALAQDLEQRFNSMQEEIDSIAKLSIETIKKQKEKVHTNLAEIKADDTLLSQAQKNALYTMLDKLDLNEEVVRFNNHLQNLKAHLQTDAIEKGKRIDFTLQECAREINTIAAKCSDSQISKHAINVKVEIEKAREQTQNIV